MVLGTSGREGAYSLRPFPVFEEGEYNSGPEEKKQNLDEFLTGKEVEMISKKSEDHRLHRITFIELQTRFRYLISLLEGLFSIGEGQSIKVQTKRKERERETF